MREHWIGDAKIGKISPKKEFTYPIVRLPKDLTYVVGHKVSIYITEDEDGRCTLKLILDDDSIIRDKVKQLRDTTDLDKRLNALESDIKEIKQAFLNKSPQITEETLKELRPGRNSNPSRLRDRQS
jgi:hypothetical protein